MFNDEIIRVNVLLCDRISFNLSRPLAKYHFVLKMRKKKIFMDLNIEDGWIWCGKGNVFVYPQM